MTNKLKLLAAGLGGVAVLASAGVSVMNNPVVSAEPETEVVTTTPLSTGETVTESTAPSEPETPSASPPVTATTYEIVVP